MSPVTERLRHLTPPQEFAILKEYLRWRVLRAVTGKMEPVMTQTQFAKKSGISKPLLTKIVKQDGDSSLGQKWAHAAGGLDLTIDAALALSRQWRASEEGQAWLRETGAWADIFPVGVHSDPESVRHAMATVDGLGLKLDQETRDKIRSEALEFANRGAPPLLVAKFAMGLAERASVMAELMPALGRSNRTSKGTERSHKATVRHIGRRK